MERATKKRTAEALEWLQNQSPWHVDEGLAFRFAARFPELSSSALRAVLLSSHRPMAPMVEGVRQDNFEDLERTLRALGADYAVAEPARQRQLRQLVISARQHADWVVRNPKVAERRRNAKAEMALWLRVWLENPPVFDVWVRLRKQTCGGSFDAM